MLSISRADAKNYIDTFYQNYPQVRIFFDRLIADCKKNGYVETMFGRRRYIP
jgi:DNA polymerase I